jgi:Flp pilus assembly protein TadD
MKTYQLTRVLLLLSLFAFIAGCSAPMKQNQLEFGINAAQQDLWEEAIFRWKKVAAEEPGSAAAHNNLAVAYEKKGMWKEAEEEYIIATKLSPGNEHISSNYEKLKKILAGQADPEEKQNEKK